MRFSISTQKSAKNNHDVMLINFRSGLYNDSERIDVFDQTPRRSPRRSMDDGYLDKQDNSGKSSDKLKLLIAGGVILLILLVTTAVLLGVLLSGSGQCSS